MVGAAVLPLAYPSAEAVQTDILTRYHSYFRSQVVDTPELLRTALAIRYQVYCLERKFENADEHSDQLESDELDAAAIHSLVIHRPSREAIGTARLILPRYAEGELPIEHLLRQNGFRAGDHFPVATSAEVSRFSISNQFRRRRGDNGISEGGVGEARYSECRGALPCLGLIREIIRQSYTLGLTHWAARALVWRSPFPRRTRAGAQKTVSPDP